jgi:hypothetical protein
VKAVQFSNGAWSPHCEFNPETRKKDGPRIPWSRKDLEAHLAGEATYGHYLLNTDNKCKLFAFDIDLEKNDIEKGIEGVWPEFPEEGEPLLHKFDARESWLDRAHPSREWQKLQLKTVAHSLARSITEDFHLPCAVAYSGGKGVHVYAFTGLVDAADARDAAAIVLDSVGGWEPKRGDNFFQSIDRNPVSGYPNLSIEVFPKQDRLSDNGLGNLMRMPLGRNLKSKDPTFFIDMTSPMGQMIPVDPEFALAGNPWVKPNE